jgi:hypothetical protein
MKSLGRILNGFKTPLNYLLGIVLIAFLGGLAKTAYTLFLCGSEEMAAKWRAGIGLRNFVRNVFEGL